MEDFRYLSRLADVQQDRAQEAAEAHAAIGRAPGALGLPRFSARRFLLSLTVVVLGMAAWWGQ